MFSRQLHMKLEDFEKKGKTRVLSYFVRVFKYPPNEVHFYLCYVLPKLFRRFCNHFPEGCRRLYLCHQMILRSEFHLDLSQFLFTLFDLWVLILWPFFWGNEICWRKCYFWSNPNLFVPSSFCEFEKLKGLRLDVTTISLTLWFHLWLHLSTFSRKYIADVVSRKTEPMLTFCCIVLCVVDCYHFGYVWGFSFMISVFWIHWSFFLFVYSSFEIITISSLFCITLKFFRLRLDAYGIFRMFDECSQ